MRVIAVDDEKLSLMKIERILRGIAQVEFVAGYKYPLEAIGHQGQDAPDVAFLDVEMPETDGLELSERLMEQNPGLEVVFVTAHEKYALQAYQTNAIGYLLKPVQEEDVRAQIERIERYRAPRPTLYSRPYCRMFGQFSVRMDAQSVLSFRTGKSEELLALLLCRRGRPIARDAICEALWPEMELDKATRNFHTTAYNIRHTFGSVGLGDILLRTHDSYRINPDCLTSDLDDFCAAAELYEKRIYRVDAIEKALAVYDGPLLVDKDYLWLHEQQYQYEQMFVKLSLRLYDERIGNGESAAAEELLHKLLRLAPTCERACELLAGLYLSAGRKDDAAKALRRFAKRYREETGEEPDPRLLRMV